MPAISELLIRIDATTEGLRRELARADQQLGGFAKNTDKSLAQVDRNVTTLGDRFQKFNATLGAVGLGMGAIEAGKWVLQQADAYVKLENQLRNVTTSQTNLKEVMGDLFASAQTYSVDITSQIELFRKLSDALKTTGMSQQDLLELTDTFAAGMKASGTSAADASRGIQQLAQAFQGGKLQAEEMNTLRETMPKYVDAIIAELARLNGMTLNEASDNLKKFMADGEITRDVMVAAAQAMREGVVAEAGNMADTTEQAMTRLRNALTMAGESFGPLIPHVSRFFEELAAGVTKSGEQIKAFTDAIQRAIAIVKEFLGVSSLSDFEGMAKNFGVNVDAVRREVEDFKKVKEDFTAAATAPASKTTTKVAGAPALGTAVMLNNFMESFGYQHGGEVSGASGVDNIPAWLTKDEFVVNPVASRKHRALLEAINDNKFASGGVVGYQRGGAASGTAAARVEPAINELAGNVGGTFTEIADRWQEAARRVDAQRAEAQRRMEAEDAAIAAKAEESRKMRAAEYSVQKAGGIDSKPAAKKGRATKSRETTDKAALEFDREAERVIEGTRSALERYNAELDSFNKLRAAGKISQDQFNAAVGEARNELNAEEISEAGRIFASTRTEAEQYAAQIRELKDLHAGGFIDEDTMRRQEGALKDALNADELADAKMLFDQTRTSAELYGEAVARIKELSAGGFIDQETTTRALKAVKEEYEDLGRTVTNVSVMADQLGYAMASSFEDAVFEGGKLRDVMKGLWDDIQRIVFRQLVTLPLASGISAILGGAMMGVPGVPMYQHGGKLGGKGSGTSDSNLAYFSEGEFLVNAKATQKHLPLLEAINDNRLPSGGVPKFAVGGSVGRISVPHFAAGGLVGPAASSGSGPIEIKLENKSSHPLKLESSQQRKGPNGGAMISVMITDAVKAALNAGEFDRGMGSRYGASVQPIGR